MANLKRFKAIVRNPLELGMKCSGCDVAAKSTGNRLPRGWHRRSEAEAYCPDCWGERYLLRAITMPVVSPVGCTWEELRADLRTMGRIQCRLPVPDDGGAKLR